MTIYAATTNTGKLREFSECARGEGVGVVALPGLAAMPEPVEDATTFMGNAELKAVAYSKLAPGLLVMADDSGLEVLALGGAPGVRSARFAEDWEGRGSDSRVRATAHLSEVEAVAEMGHPDLSQMSKDERNNALLLRLMEDVRDGERGAQFVCALAVARDGEVVLRAEGYAGGEVMRGARGGAGFGYDPLFLVAGLGETMAELGRERKWDVSHRGKAFRELLRLLRQSPRFR